MDTQMLICLAIFVITVIGYCTSFFSLATVSMVSMMALILTNCITAKDALGYLGNSTVVMIGAMCVVAAGFQRTKFCTNLATSIAKISKGSLTKMMFGYSVLAMLLSQFIQSPLVVFGIVAPLCIASADSMGIAPSKVCLPLGIVSIATCCTLPVGAGATIAAELNGYITSYYENIEGFSGTMPVVGQLDAMWGRLPMLVICVLFCTFIAPKLAPEKPVVPTSFDMKSAAQKPALKPLQEWAGIIIFFADAIALMFASKLGLATWEICMIGALLMVMFKVLSAKETISSVPWSMLLLVAGALAMSGALSATGAGSFIGSKVAGMVEAVNYNSYIVGAIFFVLPFILTQFMQNRGTMLIFHPIAIATCHTIGGNPVGLMILIQAACLTAFMTPMATGAVPYIMDYGGYDQVSMLKQGWLYAVIACVVSVVWTMSIFPIM